MPVGQGRWIRTFSVAARRCPSLGGCEPRWSPDGSAVTCVSFVGSTTGDCMTTFSATGDTFRLPPTPTSGRKDDRPQWINGGRQILVRRSVPRIQERPPDRLSGEEVAMVVALPEPHGFICRFGLGTGLRWSEMVRATAADLQNWSLVVHRTKSGKLRRIPLPADLRVELGGRIGRLMPLTDPGGFARQVRILTGITRFHAHQLRHTYACRCIECGGAPGASGACVDCDDAALREALGGARAGGSESNPGTTGHRSGRTPLAA